MPRDDDGGRGPGGPAAAAGTIAVEVVYARSERQELVALRLPSGSDVAAAIAASGIAEAFPHDDLDACDTGIWGRMVPRSALLKNGDRVELYRPLFMDPREARRRRAL
ncbi:MAG TPA: RnfH family protein [Woeseiaceae bacterium]|nr:RnfH family protein [Woeseiaceae bacterium]